MGVGVSFTDKQLMVVGGLLVVAAVGLAWYARKKAGDIANAVNPLNQNNVISAGANDVYQSISGNDVDSIGTAIYAFIHGDD